MSNKKVICLLMLIASTCMLSCENDLYDDMVDDKIYLVDAGLKEIDIGNSGSYTHEVYVIKSGIGKQDARVQLEVNQVLLDAYNEANGTEYVLLPAQYFNIDVKEVALAKETYEAPFVISFDVGGIAALQESSDAMYALPCEAKSVDSGISSDEGKMATIIVPNITVLEDEGGT